MDIVILLTKIIHKKIWKNYLSWHVGDQAGSFIPAWSGSLTYSQYKKQISYILSICQARLFSAREQGYPAGSGDADLAGGLAPARSRRRL